MSEVFAISRIAKYKYSDVGGVLKEALRILPNYDNPDCDPSKSYLNIPLVSIDLNGLTPEKYILKYREDNNIKGRFNTSATNAKNVTNCMMQTLFTASKEFLDTLSRDEQIDYFRRCLEFHRSEFPTGDIISAIIHFDETTPHMHVTWLPVAERINKKSGDKEKIFSVTKLMPGKDFLPKYQDRFYKFISEQYDGLSRGHSNRKNMSVKDYKEYMDLMEKYNALKSELDLYYKTIENQKSKISMLYDELREVRKEASFLEDIPLLGVLFKILRELKEDVQRDILLFAIDRAKAERENVKQSLDSQVLSAEKRRIVERLFGQKNNDRNIDRLDR